MTDEQEREQRLAEQRGAGWIGVDLDGTLAEYHGWSGWNVFGKPIPAMVERVRGWLAEGHAVKIMTARVTDTEDDVEMSYCRVTGQHYTDMAMKAAIRDWCLKHVGRRLEVTCRKDVHMIELWDDRAVQVVPNTGRTLAEEHAAELSALRGAP